jgi:hemerythrin-like domain-containing protein
VSPVTLLTREHRLIDEMIKLINEQLKIMIRSNKVDLDFIHRVINFMRDYVDKCHHGKEEDILFGDLAKINMTKEDKKIMKELIYEHVAGRENVDALAEAKEKYKSGNREFINDIIDALKKLADFYRCHMEKEEKYFFIPCAAYLNKEKEDMIVRRFYEFDSGIVYGIYASVIEKKGRK